MMQWTNAGATRVERAWTALEIGDLLVLRGAQGCTVAASAPRHVDAGPPPLLWLTEEGELDDVFLRPGEQHVLRRGGLVVASAWGPIGVRVLPAATLGAATHAQLASSYA